MTGASEVILITGASGGIGADIARLLAADRRLLVLVARNLDKLNAVADEIAAKGAPRPLVLAIDLAQPHGPEQLQREMADRGLRAAILVNNAGFGLVGLSRALSREEQLEMIDLNVRALTDLTLRFTPDLIASRGHLMNIASIAAFMPGPGMAVYYATKAFVLSFTEALSAELKDAGVKVTTLCPGLTPTGFQQRAGMGSGLSKLAPTMSSAAVAEAAAAALVSGRRLVVTGWINKLFTLLAPLTPRALILPTLLRAQAGRTRPGA